MGTCLHSSRFLEDFNISFKNHEKGGTSLLHISERIEEFHQTLSLIILEITFHVNSECISMRGLPT